MQGSEIFRPINLIRDKDTTAEAAMGTNPNIVAVAKVISHSGISSREMFKARLK